MRVGQGWDLHRLEPGQGVQLGCVPIPCDYAVVAHSDGDVLVHALCDALLGGAGLGDLGDHFPDTDERWRGAAGELLLRRTLAAVATAGFAPQSADLTLIAEVPRIGPHKMAIRRALAEHMGLEVGALNLKATTAEGLGDIGAARAISALAVVLLAAVGEGAKA